MRATTLPATSTSVLLVGADEMLLALARHALAGAGFDVAVADRDAAPDALTRRPADVVVVDLDGGPAAADAPAVATALDPARRAAFVFLALRGTPADVLGHIRSAGHEFVAKPFHIDELVARVTAAARTPATTSPPPARGRRRAIVVLAVLVAVAATAIAVALASAGDDRPRTQPVSRPAVEATSAAPAPAAPTPTVPATTPATPSAVAVAPTTERVARTACPGPRRRGAAALRLLHHGGWLGGTTVVFRPGRSGVLAVARPRARQVVVYVRGCSAEPLQQVAAALVDQVAQLRALSWTAAQDREWLRLRDAGPTTRAAFERDVGAVAIQWQLGTTRWWQSPLAPPTRISPRLEALLRS